MIICVDTCLLILAHQPEPVAGQSHLYENAKSYVEWMKNEDSQILLPTPVIAEFLTSRDAEERAMILRDMQVFAQVQDFDLRAAELTGAIRLKYHDAFGLPENQQRQVVTIDMMITAIAIVNGASHLITHDVDDFERIVELSGGELRVRAINEGPPGQARLL